MSKVYAVAGGYSDNVGNLRRFPYATREEALAARDDMFNSSILQLSTTEEERKDLNNFPVVEFDDEGTWFVLRNKDGKAIDYALRGDLTAWYWATQENYRICEEKVNFSELEEHRDHVDGFVHNVTNGEMNRS